MTRTAWQYLIILFLTTATAWGNATAAPPGLTEQINREGGVTIKVTPRNLDPGAKSWDFDVVLETHTRALDQDMTRVSALIDAQGKPRAPIAWEGSPPGGHHRRGLLRFRPLAKTPETLVLRLQDIGGVEARVFRWQLN